MYIVYLLSWKQDTQALLAEKQKSHNDGQCQCHLLNKTTCGFLANHSHNNHWNAVPNVVMELFPALCVKASAHVSDTGCREAA